MSDNNTNKYNVQRAFHNKDRAELQDFEAAIKAALTTHPSKLHTVLLKGTLHSSVLRTLKKELEGEGILPTVTMTRTVGAGDTATTETTVETNPVYTTRVDEYCDECNEEAYAILYRNIACRELQKTLRRKYDEKGHQAWMHIQSLHALDGNDTRITKAADRRKEMLDEGLTAGTLPVVKAFVQAIEELNAELDGTQHAMAPALFTTTVLDALNEHEPNMVQTFKTVRAAQGKAGWRDDFDAVRDELYKLLEENDRTNSKSAHAVQRKAFRAQAQSTPAASSEVDALQKQVQALTEAIAKMSGTTVDALRTRTGTLPPLCPDCGRHHATTHGCIGKRIIDGELTLEQAAALFTGADLTPADRMKRAKSAKIAAEAVRAAAKGAAQPKGATINPVKKVAGMCTRVVQSRLSTPRTGAPGEAVPTPPGYATVGMDSKCDQHIFTDPAYFPYGIQPLAGKVVIQTVESGSNNATQLCAQGEGLAVAVTRDGTMLCLGSSLYVPGALQNDPTMTGLVSVEQAYHNARAEVRFGAHRDIVFHSLPGFTVPLDAGYDLFVRPPTDDEATQNRAAVEAVREVPCAELQQQVAQARGMLDGARRDVSTATADEVPMGAAQRDASTTTERTADPITRGKSGGGTAHLTGADTARLWAMRMPGLSAERLRQLPDVTADAPRKLGKVTPEDITDDALLMANAPKLHAPPVRRRVTTHRGECTLTDLMGPLTPSKFYGNRYMAPHIDLHQQTVDVTCMPSKDRYPKELSRYISRNQGKDGCDFRGGSLYRDNEPVLNSAKVDAVLDEFDMTPRNSAEYEPWGNPAERTMRTLQEPMRIMRERGGAGEEYWEFAAHQAACIANDSHHAWGRDDDNKTPSQRKTGEPPAVAGRYRPMFCKAFVRLPPQYRTGKTDRRAEMCIHLGLNPKGPGWRFEVIDGPRKGRLVVSTQAVFRELQFPLKDAADTCSAPEDEEVRLLYPDDDDDTPGALLGGGGGTVHGSGDPPHDAPPPGGTTDGAGEPPPGGTTDGTLHDGSPPGVTTGGADEPPPGDTTDGVLHDGPPPGGTADGADGAHGAGVPAAGDSDSTSDGGGDVDTIRRSARIGGVTLPHTVNQYTRFRGVLHTGVRTVQTFATSIDMTDGVSPAPLSLDTSAVPTPTPHDPHAAALPKTFQQIMRIADEAERTRRLRAYYKEYDGLFAARSGLRVVPAPSGPHKTLKLKELPSTKKDGTAKWRVVARGDMLKAGVDYDRTFSPTVKHVTLRTAGAIAARRNQVVSGADCTQAYVLADWPDEPEPTYASHFPDGYDSTTPDGTPLACEIGNLYGKPTAGRNWYIKAERELTSGLPEADGPAMPFTRSAYDWSYFWRWEGDQLIQVLLYVDDVLVFADTEELRERFHARFGATFPVTNYGEDISAHNHEYLSIRVLKPAPYQITFDVERYITDTCAHFFPGGVHASYAVPARLELVKLVDDAVRCKGETLLTIDPAMHERFRSMVGALLFIAITTRPDAQYAAGMLSRCVAYPTPALMLEAERALIYLHSTRSLALTYTGGGHRDGSFAPTRGPLLDDGSSDASFEVNRSTSGWAWRMCGAAVSWGMKKQQSIALFSTEAEIMASSLAACDGVFLRDSSIERGFPHDAPSVLYIDNKGAIDLSHDPVLHASTKHIKRRELYIRDLVLDGTILPKYVKTADNMADIFTKPLARQSFQKHRAALMGHL